MVDSLHETIKPELESGFLDGLQDSPGRPRYIVRDMRYAFTPRPPREAILEGVLYRGDVAVAYGPPGAKKTYSFGISFPVCVANGKDWLNFKTRKTTVLIIDEESGERRLSERLEQGARGELCDETTDIQYVCLANFKLDDPTDSALLQMEIQNRGAGLVIIDALTDILDGDENSKKDTQPVFSALRKIADITNAAIVIIHHSNKMGGYRGSSAIAGAVDLMIEVKSEEGSRFITFRTTKERDIERTSWAAEAVWTDDQFYLTTAEVKTKTTFSKSESYVMRYLEENGSASMDDIMNHADTCTAQAARVAVYSLTSRGLAARVDGGGRGQKSIYALTQEKL